MSVASIVKEARETSPLNHSEYSADLEEIDADEEKLIAADYSAGINGENPEEAMVTGADEVESELVSAAVLDELAEPEPADSAELQLRSFSYPSLCFVAGDLFFWPHVIGPCVVSASGCFGALFALSV